MAGNARRYLGLVEGTVHDLCLDKISPWFRPVPVEVVEPYEDIAEIGYEVDGLIGQGESAAVLTLLMPMSDSLEDRGPGTLGWFSPTERNLLARMDAEIEATRVEIYSTGGPNNNHFEKMIDDARAQYQIIADTYHHYDRQKAYVTPGDGIQKASLNLDFYDFVDNLDTKHYKDAALEWRGNYPPDILKDRQDAREDVRKAWDHMLSVLWCCRVWLAATASYFDNRALWFERENNRNSGLAMAPQTGQSNTNSRGYKVVTPTRSTRAGGEEGGSSSMGMILFGVAIGTVFLLSKR